eukprot:757947-Hanusia_phi.AAC.2
MQESGVRADSTGRTRLVQQGGGRYRKAEKWRTKTTSDLGAIKPGMLESSCCLVCHESLR